MSRPRRTSLPRQRDHRQFLLRLGSVHLAGGRALLLHQVGRGRHHLGALLGTGPSMSCLGRKSSPRPPPRRRAGRRRRKKSFARSFRRRSNASAIRRSNRPNHPTFKSPPAGNNCGVWVQSVQQRIPGVLRTHCPQFPTASFRLRDGVSTRFALGGMGLSGRKRTGPLVFTSGPVNWESILIQKP